MRFIDLSHTFDDNMPVYPGDSAAELKQTAIISEHGHNSFCLHSGMHAGTHMDAPLHMIPDGAYLSDIPVTQFFGRGVLIDARGQQEITESLLDGVLLERGDIVLILTGWYKYFRKPDYYKDFPQVSPAFAERLVEIGVAIVGLDTPAPDRWPFPVHKILLSQNVLLIENVNNLEELLHIKNFTVFAVPAKYHCEAAHVRVVAQLHE